MRITIYSWKLFFLSVLAGCLLFSGPLSAQTISIKELPSAPSLDGSDSDWSSIPAVDVALKKNRKDGKTNIKSVSVRGGTYGNSVYFLFQWQDSSKDKQHKPFVWDNEKEKYTAGPQREDRFSIQFAMTGDYSSDWLSGKTFTADMWHWKAARSNPIGLAHDKMTIITENAAKHAFKTKADNGKTIYIIRPADQGPDLYSTKRYAEKDKDMMPKYILNENVTGSSVADVKARGVWQDNVWTLELMRKLNTGNDDDVVFVKGKTVKSGIAVFNHTGDDDHTYSETFIFQL